MSMRSACGERQIKLFLDRTDTAIQPNLHRVSTSQLYLNSPFSSQKEGFNLQYPHDPTIIHSGLLGAPRVPSLKHNHNPQAPNRQTTNMAPHRTTNSTALCPQKEPKSNTINPEYLSTLNPHHPPLFQHPLDTLRIHNPQILLTLPPLLRQS